MRAVLFAALASCASLLAATTAHAQNSSSYATASGPNLVSDNPTPPTPTAADVPATVILTGHVKSAAGPLPGAVVKIAGSNEMVVTDADGFFHVSVPANTTVKATASYAGFADENVALDDAAPDSEVRMNTAQVVKVAKHQQFKTYLKTSRKQNKKNLRRVRH